MDNKEEKVISVKEQRILTAKRAAKCFTFSAILLVLIVIMDTLLVGTFSAAQRNVPLFYNEKQESLDVVLVGPSSIYRGFMPTIAFEEQGFTSYNYSTSYQPITAQPAIISEIIRTQTPKVIVVEINSSIYVDLEEVSRLRLQEIIDNIPDQQIRLELTKLYIGEENILSQYIRLINYHGNWTHADWILSGFPLIINEYINNAIPSVLKGWASNKREKDLSMFVEVTQNILAEETIEKQYQELYEYNETKLRELLDFCAKVREETGIEFMFMRSPRLIDYDAETDSYTKDITCSKESHYMMNTVGKIVEEEYNFNYVDLVYSMFDIEDLEGNKLDFATDYYDFDHLNYYGAKKYTSFLAKFLVDTYNIVPSHSQDTVEVWEECCLKARTVYAHLEASEKSFEATEFTAYELGQVVGREEGASS